MGYRELLKRYIAYVRRLQGDDFLDTDAAPPLLSRRDLSELRLLAAEAERDPDYRLPQGPPLAPNAELRLLLRKHDLAPEELARLAGQPPAKVSAWSLPPTTAGYTRMAPDDLVKLKRVLAAAEENSER